MSLSPPERSITNCGIEPKVVEVTAIEVEP
jgi:hypothetical protein